MYLIGKKSSEPLSVEQLTEMLVCHKQHTLHQLFVDLYGKDYDTIPQLRDEFIYLSVVLCKIPGNEIRNQYELTFNEYIDVLTSAQDQLENDDYLDIVKYIYTQYNLNINQN